MTDTVEVVVLSRWNQVRDAYRRKELRQAMYDEGAVVMAGCLLDLHGDAHRDRRRLENRLFRREIFTYWEREVLGSTIDATLAPFIDAGAGDLPVIGYRCAMNLTATIAGIDHDPADADAVAELEVAVKKLSEGATLVHSTRDHEVVRTEVEELKAEFVASRLAPSRDRRQAIIDDIRAGKAHADALPHDVLTTLLWNEDGLDLSGDVIEREVCFYLQAGGHSTANAFTHTIDDLFAWAAEHPEDLGRAHDDRLFAQRCMHESLRLNPASPVAWRRPLSDVTLADGTVLPEGSRVVIDLIAANRDTDVWGPDADRFDPHRTIPDGANAWGMSFGGGRHACIGQELDGGLEVLDGADPAEHLYGTVPATVSAFLAAGGRPDPDRPATLDPNTQRKHFSTYPVVFDRRNP
jgi:cytochrome P450